MKKLIRIAPLTMVLLILTSCSDGKSLESVAAQEAWNKAQNTRITKYPTTLQAEVQMNLSKIQRNGLLVIKESSSYKVDKSGNVYLKTYVDMKIENVISTIDAEIYIIDSVSYVKARTNIAGQLGFIKVKGNIDEILNSSGLPDIINDLSIASFIEEIQDSMMAFTTQVGITFDNVDAYIKSNNYIFKVKKESCDISFVFNGQYFISANINTSLMNFYNASLTSYKGAIKVNNPDSYEDYSESYF